MNVYTITKVGIIIYAVFASLGISGIQIGVSIALLGMIILLLKKQEVVLYTNKESKRLLVFLTVFVLLCILSIILSIDMMTSSKRFVSFIGEIILIYAVFNLHDENSKFKKQLIDIILVCCVLQSVYGILQYFTGIDIIRKTQLKPFERIHGTLGHWNSLGGILGMVLPIMFSYTIFIPKGHIKQKVLYSISFVLISLALIFTSTRGAWIGATLSIIFISVVKLKWKTVFIILLLPSVLLFSPVRKRIYNTLLYPESGRIYIWKKSVILIKEKPITGYGLDSFQKLLYEKPLDQQDKVSEIENGHFHAHNIFINTAVETGIISCVLLVIVLVFILKYAISSISRMLIRPADISTDTTKLPIVIGITGSIIDFCLHGMVDNVLRGETAYLFWFLVGILFSI